MNKEEFKNYVNEIAINELRNSFDNNLMETLNSAFIFKYVETLEKELDRNYQNGRILYLQKIIRRKNEIIENLREDNIKLMKRGE